MNFYMYPKSSHLFFIFLETLAAEHENVESVPKQILPRPPEGKC